MVPQLRGGGGGGGGGADMEVTFSFCGWCPCPKRQGGSVGRASNSRSKDRRYEPQLRQEHKTN